MTEAHEKNPAPPTEGSALPPLHLALAGLCLGALACSVNPPDLKPPPYGPDVNNPRPTQLFFPTGLAVAPSGHLLVVNGNFDHSYNGGTIVAITPDFLAPLLSYYDSSLPLSAPLDLSQCPPLGTLADSRCPPFLTGAQLSPAFSGVAMVGNYGGPLAIYSDQPADGGTRIRAFTGSRDSATLDAVELDPATGKLSCAGSPGEVDCRAGAVDTLNLPCSSEICPPQSATLSLEGPYGVVTGQTRLPGSGTAAPRDALFVAALIPHIDAIDNGTILARSQFAAFALDSAVPSLIFAANTSTQYTASGSGTGPAVFDRARRQLILGGCYTRFTATNGIDPSSGKCASTGSNIIRFVNVDDGAAANVQEYDLAQTVRSFDTADLALGGYDASGVPQRLYVTTRFPDLLVELALSSDPRILATVVRATALPLTPAGMVVLQRPASIGGGPDLIAVVAEGSSTVTIYDTGSGTVVANLEHLGTKPYTAVQLPSQASDATPAALADPRAHLAITEFDACALALVDVPFLRPWQATLRATLGSCPQ